MRDIIRTKIRDHIKALAIAVIYYESYEEFEKLFLARAEKIAGLIEAGRRQKVEKARSA